MPMYLQEYPICKGLEKECRCSGNLTNVLADSERRNYIMNNDNG